MLPAQGQIIIITVCLNQKMRSQENTQTQQPSQNLQ